LTERETLLSVQTAQDFIILLHARFEVSPDEVHFGLSGTVRAAILLFQHNFLEEKKGIQNYLTSTARYCST